MELLENTPFPDIKGKLLSPEPNQLTSKTVKMEPNWFTSSAYKEKVGIYSKFSDVFLTLLHNSFTVFTHLYSNTLEDPTQDFKRQKDLIYTIKRTISNVFDQINEIFSVYDLTKTVLLQDVTGLNYKLISRLTTIVGQMEEFLMVRKSSFEQDNQSQQIPKTLNNWVSVYCYLFSRFVDEINFNLRLFDPKSNITQKLKKSLQLSNILTMLFKEMAEIFTHNTGRDLLTMVDNFKVGEINDLDNINERMGVDKIKATSPLNVFQDFNFVLKPHNLGFIENKKDVEFMCKAANNFKKLSLLRFSEICQNEHKRKQYPIEMPEYFKPHCQYKYIHFFKPFSKFLILFDISTIQPNINIENGHYMKIPLNISFDLAYESRSVITPEGEIYLAGGKFTERGMFKPDRSFHVLDYEKLTLIELAKMPVAKKLEGIAYLQRNIFLIGGRTDERKCTGECERYDISAKKWRKIANINEPVIYPSIAAFGDRYLYKFGGINQYDFLDKTIERYDFNSNVWWIVRYSETSNDPNHLSLLYQSLACQINERQILIFGGRNMNGFKIDSMMVFEPGDEEKSNLSKTRLFGTMESGFDIPKNILSFAGDFHENSQIICNNSVYFLRKDYFG